jgi:ABC-type dipeptide/oligopeptide/nickel transport system permease component
MNGIRALIRANGALFYLIRRLALVIPTLFFASFVVFLVIRLIPGDAAAAFAGPDATAEQLAALRDKMGLNQPLYVQYGLWLLDLFRGDFGDSNVSGLPVVQLIAARFPATAELAFAAILMALTFAVPVGIVAALHHRRSADRVVSAVTSIGLSIPEYWTGLLAILLFAVYLKVLPPGGRTPPDEGIALWLRSLLLPAITLGFPIACMQARFVRASMIDVMREQYILTARSKGIQNHNIVLIHALRNTLIPLMTVMGIQLGRLMGGAILVESVYNWPGIGRLMVQSITQRDYALVQATVLLIVLMFAVLNLIVDLLYGIVDPRVVMGEETRR